MLENYLVGVIFAVKLLCISIFYAWARSAYFEPFHLSKLAEILFSI